jgi:hypothetical protein
MRDCTGEHYPGEFQILASIEGWHGKFGHLNVVKRDHDDICTHYGQHDRVVTSLPQFEDEFGCITLYARVDHVWELGHPTPAQIIDVARKHDGTKGHWCFAKKTPFDNSTEYWFVRPADKLKLYHLKRTQHGIK